MSQLNPVHVVIAGVSAPRCSCCAGVAGAAGSSAAASPTEPVTQTIRISSRTEYRGETRPCRQRHTPGATPYYFVPAPSRHPVLAATGLFFVILGAGQWINGHGWGAYSLLLGPRDLAASLFAVVPPGHRRERGRPVQRPRRRVVPLEHELVHLLGGDVLRRLLRRAVLGARALRCPTSATWTTQLLWPDFKAVWPSAGRAHRVRRPASSSPSRPWARGRCRPSTPRCC